MTTPLRQLLFTLDDKDDECELWYSENLGETAKFIEDFGKSSVGGLFDFGTFGAELFLANGVIAPRLWDGSALTIAGASQINSPAVAEGASGNLNGSYRFRVSAVKSDKTNKPASIQSPAISVQSKKVTLTWNEDPDTDVVGYNVWSTSGSGLDFYLVEFVAGRTTLTYEDNTSDRLLITHAALSVVASHGDPPPVGLYFCVPHKGRVWWGRLDEFPRRWYWSDAGDADSVYTERNYLDTTDAKSVGDVATGGTPEYEGLLVLWCRNSVWVVTGTGTIVNSVVDWRKRRTNAKTGTVWHRTVGRVGSEAVYLDQEGKAQTVGRNMLAYLTPLKDIRLFDGSNDYIISFPKKDTLSRINAQWAHRSYCYDDVVRGMMVWVVPIDSSEEANYSIAWNYIFGTWHEWTGTNFGHVWPCESDTEEGILIGGENRIEVGGVLYRLFDGDLQDQADIESIFLSKPIYAPIQEGGQPDLSYEKRLEVALLLFAKDASPVTEIDVEILPHDADDDDEADIIKSVSGDTRVRVQTQQQVDKANPGKFFSGVGWRLRIVSVSGAGPWILKGMEYLYTVLKGRTR